MAKSRTREFLSIAVLCLTAILSRAVVCEGARYAGFRNSNLENPNVSVAPQSVANTTVFHHELRNPVFSSINRRTLISCNDPNPYLSISIDATSPLSDVQTVTVTVSGIVSPSADDWIAVVSPSSAQVKDCPLNKALYVETGDLSSLPLLCHYPVKYQYVSADPQYLSCGKSECQESVMGKCLIQTCSASISFRLINIRTDVSFVFFAGGMAAPCILNTSSAVSFANPSSPLYGHLSSVDSTGTSMRLTWVSGDGNPQQINYNGQTATSTVSTFAQNQMCSSVASPATDFGWHDPGNIHTAVMTGLSPSTAYTYTYGSASAGWSASTSFTTPPAAGASAVNVVMYGDMGKAERDNSGEHYVQPGSLGVIDAVGSQLTSSGNVDVVVHIGDISYATGFLVEWDSFLEMINPIASKVSYMTAIGNHERDFPGSGSVYETSDSGGECGVAYESYFQMPTSAQDKPWYSFESGPVHFTIMSTEHAWTSGNEQYDWIKNDLASVDRTKTPWVIFAGHRPAYSSVDSGIVSKILPAVDPNFPPAIEPLLLNGQVDLVVWGHVHNYERTCAVYQNNCLGMPSKDSNGLDTYNSATYTAPVHAVIGMAGFTLDTKFSSSPGAWSLSRISEYGYSYIQANANRLLFQYISSTSGQVKDSFAITKS